MQTKGGYRTYIRSLKRKERAERLAGESASVMAAVEALPQFRAARTVACYWSLPDELHTHDFIRRWWEEKQILLPVMRGDFRLELKRCGCDTTLNEGGYRIMEPEGEACPASSADLIIVPGVAFDASGRRLGRGMGYYDRLLKEMSAFKVGVCYGFQFFGNIPSDDHDVSMDLVIYG